MLFRGIVPQDEVNVTVHCCVPELPSIADNCMEVSLRRGDEIRVVHQDSPWEIFPSPYAEVDEGLR